MTKQAPTSADAPDPVSRRMNVATLSRAADTNFDIRPDRTICSEVAEMMRLTFLENLRFKGALSPRSKDGWRLSARLTARTGQPCVVTLEPVAQTIDQKVSRDLLPAADAPEAIDLDLVLNPDAPDEPDYFEEYIDIGAILLEELALALDPYPRAPDVDLSEVRATPPGADPLDAEAVKPFAKLAELKRKLENGDP
ncbi:MAG: YceD family protein [Pseudomonadota bacterium]